MKTGEAEAGRLAGKIGARVCVNSPVVDALLNSVRWGNMDSEDALVACVCALHALYTQAQGNLVNIALRLPPAPIIFEKADPNNPFTMPKKTGGGIAQQCAWTKGTSSFCGKPIDHEGPCDR